MWVLMLPPSVEKGSESAAATLVVYFIDRKKVWKNIFLII